MSDVARAAGVSHQTVSRVLNNHPNVRPDTRDRVLEAIHALGYRRNSAARALVTRKSGTIGVVTAGSALSGPTSTLNGVEVAARERGLFVSLATIADFDAATMTGAIDHLLGQGVEGIVVIAPQDVVAQAVARVEAPCPIAMISATEEQECGSIRAVSVDQEAGGRIATRHLLELGHREIVHLAGPLDWFDARARITGWREECEAAGLGPQRLIEGDWTSECGYEVGRQMAREGAPSSVFAANDQLALGLLHAFWEAGLRVSRDVSVIGFDDLPGAAHFIPPLTTMRQDFQALGRLAIMSILARLGGDTLDVESIAPVLQIRQSTGRPE